VKRVISGIAALALTFIGGCASSNSPPAQTSPTSTSLGGNPPVRQPMADETRQVDQSQAHKNGDPRRYHPVAAVEVPSDRVIARVNGQPITMGELQKPLIEGYGLRVLLFQIQLSLARQKAVEQKVTYTQADVEAELERTLKVPFKDAAREDYPMLLNQLLERQGVSRAEFDMVIETNTILRRIAEPQLKDKITDDNLQEMFNAVYGETAVVRHIQSANPLEAQQAKTRIAAGEKWEDVVRAVSRNARTAALDGELPPFTRQTVNWAGDWGKVPEGFKQWAFGGAKVGDVSDPVQADGAYHILKLERKVQPKVIKFEDVKEGLRSDLHEKLIDQGVNELRNQLGVMAKRSMSIDDPTLRKQYEVKVSEQAKAIKDEDRIRNELKGRVRAATQEAAIQPATQPATTRPASTTQPAAPATKPAK
jgi:hypothetical protein